MTINDETRFALRELGLNAYEIDTYLVLLSSGQMTAMEISQQANVPYSKMYEVLNSLKEKGWIKSSETRPFKYYPVPPLEATRFTKLQLEDKYAKWEKAISKTLQPLYEKHEIVERPDILILRGQQAVLLKVEEVFRKATLELVIAAPEFAKPLIVMTEPFLENWLNKTVNVKLMAAGTKDAWLFIKKHAIGELRIRDHMFGGGIIADGKEAMLFLGEDKPNLVIWSNHVGLVGFAREYFQFLWDSSAKI
ncbi:MAG: helix-turn-helix domain-containing protein [Candidatus Bathyarchaeia archaeon]|nr:helix-turn-helix domain-containing protein [Candidatus Bathyarchaeota archaeon]MDI9579015.1 helix-turn-helix domain-containing protein [Thermoproteota archaeon]NLD65104.1 TrmB family transcriptional regulator [Thermoproteota archaeon]